MGGLMKCVCGDVGGRELPKYHEIRKTKFGFQRISVLKLQPIPFLIFSKLY
jgi:hypothetical protein